VFLLDNKALFGPRLNPYERSSVAWSALKIPTAAGIMISLWCKIVFSGKQSTVHHCPFWYLSDSSNSQRYICERKCPRSSCGLLKFRTNWYCFSLVQNSFFASRAKVSSISSPFLTIEPGQWRCPGYAVSFTDL